MDFCLRVRALGYRALFTPCAELYHYERSRGLDTRPGPERFEGERRRMKRRYGESLLRDPFYNPNLTLDREWIFPRATPCPRTTRAGRRPWIALRRRCAA